MYRLGCLAALLILTAASVACADVPLPANLKQVNPRVRLEGIDRYSGYTFFLKYRSGPGNPYASPPTFIEVKDTAVFEMKCGRRTVDLQLFAVPKEDARKLKAKDPTLAWLNDKTPGLLQASMTVPDTVIPVKAREAPVTPYRVTLEDSKLSVKKLDVETPQASSAGSSVHLVVVGLTVSASVALFGIWLVRRRLA